MCLTEKVEFSYISSLGKIPKLECRHRLQEVRVQVQGGPSGFSFSNYCQLLGLLFLLYMDMPPPLFCITPTIAAILKMTLLTPVVCLWFYLGCRFWSANRTTLPSLQKVYFYWNFCRYFITWAFTTLPWWFSWIPLYSFYSCKHFREKNWGAGLGRRCSIGFENEWIKWENKF